jgi:hypothetical protein
VAAAASVRRKPRRLGFALTAITATRPSARETPDHRRLPVSGDGTSTPSIKASHIETFRMTAAPGI